MQGSPIRASEPRGLPMGKLLPGYLKDLGYITRIIGKWHLGFFRPDFTPTYRGFDSHLGYLNGLVSYYDYVLQEDVSSLFSLNFLKLKNYKIKPFYARFLTNYHVFSFKTEVLMDLI